jgi:hypothetical protein
MEQIQYESFAEKQPYDPIQTPDLNTGLKENFETYLRSLGANLEQSERNAKIAADNLSGFNKEALAFLTKTSKTAADYFKGRAIAEAEEAKADAAVQARQDYLSGRRRDPAFQQQLDEASRQDDAANSASAGIQQDNPTLQDAVFPLYSNTAWKQAMYVRAMAKQLVKSDLPAYIEARIDEANPQNRAERAAVIAKAESDFFKEKGLSNLNKDFLEDIYPTVAEITDPIADRYNKAEILQKSEVQRLKDRQILFETQDLTKWLDSTSVSVDGNGVLGYKGAWQLFDKEAPYWLASGQMTNAQFLAFGRQVIPAGRPGAGKPYGEFYRTRFYKIARDADSLRKADNDAEQAEIDRQFREAEDRAIQLLLENPDYTSADVDALQRELQLNNNGRTSTRLEGLKTQSLTERQIKDQKEQAEALAKSGGLTVDFVMQLDPSIRSEYLRLAKDQERLRKANNSFTGQYKVIRTQIGAQVGVTPDGEGFKNYTAEEYYLDKIQRFDELVAQISAEDPTANAPKEALDIIKGEIETELGKDGKPGTLNRNNVNVLQKYLPSNTTPAARAARQSQLDALGKRLDADKGQALFNDPNDPTFTKEELENLQGKSIQFQLSPKITYIASRLGLSPIEVLMRVRRKFGLPQFPNEDRYTQVNNEANPDLLREFRQRQTPATSLRLLSDVNRDGSLNDDIIPGGLSGAINSVSAQYGIPISLFAGLVEVYGWNQFDYSKGDPVRSMSIIGKQLFDLYQSTGSWERAIEALGIDNPDLLQTVKRNAAKYGGDLPVRPSMQYNQNTNTIE